MIKHLLSAGVFAFVLSFAAAADASLEVTFSAGASSKTIVDGGLGDLDGLENNTIAIYNELIGGYSFTFTLAMTNNPGVQSLAFLQSSTASRADIFGGPSTVKVLATASGFTNPITPPDISAQSSATAQFLGGTPSGNTATVSYTATAGGSIVGSASDTITQFSDPNAALSDQSLISSLGPGPYALTLELVAHLDQSGSSIDVDGQIALTPAPVPELTSFVVWSMLAFGGVAACRRGRKA